jgi:hypothetical protein
MLEKVDLGEFEVKTYLKIDDTNSIPLANTSHFEIDNDYLDYMNFSQNKQENQKEERLSSAIILQKLAKDIYVS